MAGLWHSKMYAVWQTEYLSLRGLQYSWGLHDIWPEGDHQSFFKCESMVQSPWHAPGALLQIIAVIFDSAVNPSRYLIE